MPTRSQPNEVFVYNAKLYNESPSDLRTFKDEVDAAIGAGGTVALREIDSDHTTIPTIDASDVGSFIYNVNTTPNNLSVLALGNTGDDTGYQAYIGAQMLGPGATDGADLFFATRPAGGSYPKERMRLSDNGVFTFRPGSTGTETDLSAWVLGQFRLTRELDTSNERYLMIVQPYVTLDTGAVTSYEKAGILVQAKTNDPSGVTLRDMVAIHGQTTIASTNPSGRAWGGISLAYVESGGNGLAVGHEFGVINYGSDQPNVDTTTSKYSIHLTSSGTGGTTAGIKFTGSGGIWHKMISAHPAYIGANAADSFIELEGTWRVKKDGSTGIGIDPLGMLDVYNSSGTAAAWSYIYGNVSGNNPSALRGAGLSVGWNRSNGAGETNLIFGTFSGSAPRLEIGEWNGTTYASVMVAKSGGKVGVGTLAPTHRFDVEVANATTEYTDTTTYAAGFGNVSAKRVVIGYDETTEDIGLIQSVHSGVGFKNFAINAMGGNVAVGNINPLAKFHVTSTTEQLRLAYDVSNYASFTVGSGGNLTVAPTGDFVFDPVGKDILPNTNYDLNIGAINKKYLTIHGAELWVQTIVAQETVATIGGRILVGPSTVLTSDLTSGATSIVVKHNQMVSGDRVYLEANGSVEYMAITSGPSGGGPYTYSVTRDLDGSGANAWPAGTTVVNTGTTGNGFIDIYSIRGVKSASQAGPTIAGNVRNSATYNDWSEHWAIGNLNGLYGYGSTTYGVAFGKYAASVAHITIDATNGYRTFSGLSTVVQQIDNSGNITVGEVGAGKANTYISAGAFAIRLNTTNLFGVDTSGNVTMGTVATDQGNAFWNASNKRLEFRGSTAGTVVQAYVDTTGAITAGAGKVILDSNGIQVLGQNTKTSNSTIRLMSSTGADEYGALYALPSATQTILRAEPGSSTVATLSLWAECTVTNATVDISAFVTGGTGVESIRLKSGTGISTTGIGVVIGANAAPNATLDVRGTGLFTSTVQATRIGLGQTPDSTAQVGITGHGDSFKFILDDTTSYVQYAFFESSTKKAALSYAGSSSSGFIGGAGAVALGTISTTPVALFTNSTARLTIDGSGNSIFSGQLAVVNANPLFILQDTTASAKYAYILVDANLFQIREQAGASASLFNLDLSGNNMGLGTATFGTSAASVFAIKNGTEPTTSPADTVQLYSVDLSAGNATLGLRTETAVVTETVTSDRTLSVRINGTTYKICLKS